MRLFGGPPARDRGDDQAGPSGNQASSWKSMPGIDPSAGVAEHYKTMRDLVTVPIRVASCEA